MRFCKIGFFNNSLFFGKSFSKPQKQNRIDIVTILSIPRLEAIFTKLRIFDKKLKKRLFNKRVLSFYKLN
jgi:hypothetical protein